MVKVLIYSSKQIYDNASYEGRAESNFVAYRRDDGYYEITKNRTGRHLGSYCSPQRLEHEFSRAERDDFYREIKDYQLSQTYKNHPDIQLMKNNS